MCFKREYPTKRIEQQLQNTSVGEMNDVLNVAAASSSRGTVCIDVKCLVERVAALGFNLSRCRAAQL
eukprot:1061435-Amphidinium_carterae.1